MLSCEKSRQKQFNQPLNLCDVTVDLEIAVSPARLLYDSAIDWVRRVDRSIQAGTLATRAAKSPAPSRGMSSATIDLSARNRSCSGFRGSRGTVVGSRELAEQGIVGTKQPPAPLPRTNSVLGWVKLTEPAVLALPTHRNMPEAHS